MFPRIHDVALLTVALQVQLSHSYASWFVERSSSCWTELRDSTEVVMNNYIVPVDKSPHADDVLIDVFDKDLNERVAIEMVNGQRVIYIDDFTKDGDAAFGQDEKWSKEYVVKLKIVTEDLKDQQYVMDAKVSPELDDEEMEKLNGSEARMQAEFFSPVRGCSNYRAAGRGRDDGVHLKVSIPSSVFKLSDIGNHSIDLVAGYAGGHEAVTLTHSIFFLPRPKKGRLAESGTSAESSISDVENIVTEDSELDKSVLIQDVSGELARPGDTSNNIRQGTVSEVGKKLTETMGRHKLIDEDPELLGDDADLGELNGEEYKGEHDQKQEEEVEIIADGPRQAPKRKMKRHGEEDISASLREFTSKYNKENFGRAKFTTKSFLTGLLVFVCVGGTFINTILAMSKPQNHKGQYEL